MGELYHVLQIKHLACMIFVQAILGLLFNGLLASGDEKHPGRDGENGHDGSHDRKTEMQQG